MENIKIISKTEQENSPLFGGRLYENRPISFPYDGKTNAYSSLFYWANVEAVEDGEFGLHPHKGFEIMTFIFKGALEHYDTKTQKWTPLLAGGVQVIQSGNGIQHAEKYVKDSQAFQMWLDPDFSKALQKPAEYKDYQQKEFSWVNEDGLQTMHYVGNKGPIKFDSEGLAIRALKFEEEESHKDIKLNPAKFYSMYLLKGELSLADNQIVKDDYIILQNTENIDVKVAKDSELFIVETPQNPSYITYTQRINGI